MVQRSNDLVEKVSLTAAVIFQHMGNLTIGSLLSAYIKAYLQPYTARFPCKERCPASSSLCLSFVKPSR